MIEKAEDAIPREMPAMQFNGTIYYFTAKEAAEIARAYADASDNYFEHSGPIEVLAAWEKKFKQWGCPDPNNLRNWGDI